MAEFSFQENAQTDLSRFCECSVCSSRYNYDRNKPIIIPCGHTFCLECIRKIRSCATCRHPIDVQCQGVALPTNYDTYDKLMMESLHKQAVSRLTHPEVVPCQQKDPPVPGQETQTPEEPPFHQQQQQQQQHPIHQDEVYTASHHQASPPSRLQPQVRVILHRVMSPRANHQTCPRITVAVQKAREQMLFTTASYWSERLSGVLQDGVHLQRELVKNHQKIVKELQMRCEHIPSRSTCLQAEIRKLAVVKNITHHRLLRADESASAVLQELRSTAVMARETGNLQPLQFMIRRCQVTRFPDHPDVTFQRR